MSPKPPHALMPKSRVQAYVDDDLMAKYRERFPGNGTLSWLLEVCITELLDLTDGQPDLLDVVRSAVRQSLLQTRLRNRRHVNTSTGLPDGVSVESAPILSDHR